MVRVLHEVKVRYNNKVTKCIALFDTGASISIIKKSFIEKEFGKVWKRLEKPRYIELTLIVNDILLEPPETILVVDDFVNEIEIEGRKIKLPDLIIGSSTMDKYGISIHPEKGIEVVKAVPLI